MALAWHTGRRLAVGRPTWCAASLRPVTEEDAMAPVCVFDVNETLLDRAALEMTAARLGIELSDDDRESVAGGMTRLPAHPEPYRMAAARLAPADVLLIAAHAWDVTGARAAGCQAAFVARPGKVPDPLADPPDLVVTDLDDLATRLPA
jgi:hypothetical protein